MSVSEQEVKNQVAEMRAALDSIHASARIGSWVRILGVVVGLVVVGCYVWAFINLGRSVVTGGRMKSAVEKEVKMMQSQLNLNTQLPALGKEVAKVYQEQGMEMLKGLEVQDLATEQFQQFLQDVRPIIQSEFDRISPTVEAMLRTEGERLLDDLHELVNQSVNQRLVRILTARQSQIQQLVGTDDIDEFVQQIRDAAQGAAVKLVQRSWDRYAEETDKITDLLNQIPPLPGEDMMTEEELGEKLKWTLLAYLRFKLPDAQTVLTGEGR
jgi:hypothetical protein